jgi:glycosyltransferase involved in cell wall biosynthesis
MTLRVAIAYNFNDRDWLGGKNYFSSLFRAVEVIKSADVQFVFITGVKTATTLPEEFSFLEVVRTPLMDRLHPLWLARQVSLRGANADPLFARFLHTLNVDVLSHSGHVGANSGIRTAPWLYDFQFMHLPELWQPRHIRWAEQRYRAACKNGDALIVSSNHALSDLNRFAPWCSKPKHVLKFVSNPIEFSKLLSFDVLRDQYDVPLEYFYLPNQFWANKNHKLAIEALADLRARGVQSTIICTGQTIDGRQPQYFSGLKEYVSTMDLVRNFRILGVVPYHHAQSLMAHSRAVINPSLFEGWSTTVEEAKTMQKRLLLSDIPVHREQCPSLADFFSTADAENLAHLMQKVLAEDKRSLNRESIEFEYGFRLREFGRAFVDIVRSLECQSVSKK